MKKTFLRHQMQFLTQGAKSAKEIGNDSDAVWRLETGQSYSESGEATTRRFTRFIDAWPVIFDAGFARP